MDETPIFCDHPDAQPALPEAHHGYGPWSRPRVLHPNDSHLFQVRVCERCGQEQHREASPRRRG